MDPSWQPVMSAAQRRKQRRLRSWWRHEQQSIAAALATFAHHSAPRGQKTARAGGGPRVEVHGGVPGDAPPQAAGAVYYEMDTGEDDGSAPAAERPAPLLEVLPQAGLRRHTGEAFELVLDPVVPQLGRDLTVLPDPMVSRFRRCFEAMDEVERVHGPEAARRLQDALRQGALERETGEHEQEEGEARSSNKMGKKGKRRRRRKKKLPKGSSSSLLHDLRRGRRGAANEYVEVAGYSGGVETAPYMAVMTVCNVTSIYGRSGAAANSTAWSPSRVLGQLDTRLGAPRTLLVMRLFSRGTPTQFVKQTRQLCVGARVGWSLQGWSVWRRPLRQ